MSVEFLKKILPSKGLYCVARVVSKGRFAHTFWNNINDAYTNSIAQDNQGHTVYIAQATFRTSENRKHENTNLVRSFWLDIDCGANKPYATQLDGVLATKDFCHDMGFPIPSLVNSGNGLYAYWSMLQDMPVPQWKGIARLLKDVCNAAGLQADNSRTSDESSVLRPVGIHHRKDPLNIKIATLIADRPAVSLIDFATALGGAAKKCKIKSLAIQKPQVRSDLNNEFSAGLEGPPSDPIQIAEKCPQVRLMRDSGGNIPEPLWYALIGVLRYAEGGAKVIHDWSSGYSGYSVSETQAKIDQHKVAPTTCSHIGELNPEGCFGCTHASKIKTPLVLGRTFGKITPIEDDRPEIPSGFSLTSAGIIFQSEEPVLVYPYDLYPVTISYDESLGYETVILRHQTPQKEWKEFSVRSSMVHDKKQMLMTLHDNHVQVTGSDEKKLMVVFVENYIAKLRAQRKLATLSSQMGWKTDDGEPKFVLGDRIFSPHAPVQTIGFARNVPEVVKAYREKGDFSEWKELMGVFAHPDMMGHAFSLIAAGFGSPLLHFTGYSGAMICQLGKTGVGKTMTARLAQSIYGDHTKLMMLQDDTKNGLIARLGVYGSLPMTIDEVSNMDKMELSNLVHKVTQGREKVRLTRSANEKVNINSWQTIVMVSSNHSLIERLATAKSDVGAELNRLFEFTMFETPGFGRDVATKMHRTITNNYGHAGAIYIQYLIDNYDAHAPNLDKITNDLDTETDASNEERFWSAIGAVSIYAGMITNKLGITNLNITMLRKWIIKQIRVMRNEKVEIHTTGAEVIADFLDKFASNIVIVGGDLREKDRQIWRVPVSNVVARFDTKTSLININRRVLRSWMAEQYISFSTVMNEFDNIKYRNPVIKSVKTKCLGSGIATLSSASVGVVTFDLSHPVFGRKAAEIIKTANEEFKANQMR